MKRLASLAPLIALLGACTVPVRYAPVGAPAQLLHVARLPPLTIEAASEAGRGDIRIHRMGGSVDAAIDITGHPVDTGVDWTGALRDALALELERLGWPASANATPGAARLKATLVEAKADYSAGFASTWTEKS